MRNPRRQFAYYLLAAVSLATIGCTLWMNRLLLLRIEAISKSNARWAAHMHRFGRLANLATAVNAPGNDVFVTGDPQNERQRMHAAREEFEREILIARTEFEEELRQDQSIDPSMARMLDAVAEPMVRLVEFAENVFLQLEAGNTQGSTRQMAAMDAELSKIHDLIERLNLGARIVQSQKLDQELRDAEVLECYEIAIGIVVAAIVGAVAIHGHLLSRRFRSVHDETERLRAQLGAIVEGAPYGILLVDSEQVVVFASPSIESIFGYSPAELKGTKITRLLPRAVRAGHDALFASYLNSPQPRPLGAGRELAGMHSDGSEIPVEISVSPVMIDGRLHVLATLVDVSRRRAVEQESEHRAKLLKAVSDLQSAVIAGNDAVAFFGGVLEAVLELTGSEYGFLGEVLLDASGVPYVKPHASSNIPWDEATLALHEIHDASGFELRPAQSLIGRVASGCQPIIANSLESDPCGGDLPAAHRAIRAFAGMPLLRGDKTIGVMCLANRPEGYDLDLVRRLRPVLTTCAAVIAAGRGENERLEAENSLRQSMDDVATARARAEEYAIELELRNAQLEQSKSRADAANRAKGEFLANMSHEIRTPMTAILGFTEVLLDTSDSPTATEARIDAVRTIQRNGEHLLGIINDILDLSKIDAGKLKVEAIPCSPAALIADVLSLMHVRATSKGIVLTAEYDTPLPEQIITDPTRLRQILVNLIGNAIKFTEVGSVRLIARLVRDEKPRLEFDVVDSGIGLTLVQREHLFQAFNQADSSTTRKFGGTGLGLTISKRLAELLGGDTFIVESTPGIGTRFRVTIDPGPLTDVRMLAPDVAAPTVSRSNPAAAGAPSLAGARILLAEDGPDNQRLISLVLRKAGAEVTVVENGQLAVDELLRAEGAGQAYDVLLTDMQMPVMDGYHAAALLRAKGHRGPIVALTAHAMSGDREKCLAAGCDDFATKPIDRAVLVSTLAKYCVHATSAREVSLHGS